MNLKLKEKIVLITGSSYGIGCWKGTKDLIIKKKDWNLSFNKYFITYYNSFNIPYSLIDKKKGSIIAISSIAGLETLNAPTEYSVSKTSLVSYCKNLSKKLKSGIRINVISPGNVYMKGNNWDKKLKKDKSSVLKYIKNNVPLNRFASPDEIANLALFLSSDLSSFIHGSNIIIDGGQTNKIS